MSNNQKIQHWKTVNSYYTKDIIDQSLNNKVSTQDLDNYYTKQQTDQLLENKQDLVTTGTVVNIDYNCIDGYHIQITWTDPQDNNWYNTTLVRKLNSMPTSIDDGTIILTSSVKNQYSQTPYVDTLPNEASENNIYYYRLFTASVDNEINNIDNSFQIDGSIILTTLRKKLKNGTINSSNIGDTFTIHHGTYGDIQMQMVAYDDAELADDESATHTMTLLSKNCICLKQFEAAQKAYVITEDTVYRPDAIVMFNTSSTFSYSSTINYLIDDISKTGIQRSWTSFSGQYMIKYNTTNNRWELKNLYNINEVYYYLNDIDITNGNWYNNLGNYTSSYFVTYIKKYYSGPPNYTQKAVILGEIIEPNTYELNPKAYSHSSSSYYPNYKNSGIRQWLNGSGYDWYSPSNIFCNPPDYVNETGFMDGLPSDFKSALATVKIRTNLNSIDQQGYNGYKYDITEDKIFLPSFIEMLNLNYESHYIRPQGNYWSYFDSNQKRIKSYNNQNTSWWLRSVLSFTSASDNYYSLGIIKDTGNNGHIFANNSIESIEYGVVLACVLKSL